MQTQMRTTAAGPDGVLLMGKVYDLPATRARPMIDGGFATHVERNTEGKWVPTAATAEVPAKK